ncbi:uncharacterized protein LOC143191452 isoform X2 [Rhynchophorus ferrugineus]|uniref:uncharacterized protein LOC143191452 isoform X2 n=1 Tax=Rhynchophorus ferrugineus TaxID=354439 RepID=UPI003FCE2A23
MPKRAHWKTTLVFDMPEKLKHLKDLSTQEQKEFMDSFDTVLCDIDGVIWSGKAPIEHTSAGIKALRRQGKRVYFVTNNTTVPLPLILDRLAEFEIKKDEILRPDLALIWYLKSINFDKEIYVVGFKSLKETLQQAGFRVHDDNDDHVEEIPHTIYKSINNINPNVGAVIMDVDVNITFIKMQKCVEYLKKNDAIFLVGGWDPVLPFNTTKLIGPKYFIQAVEDLSNKKPTILSKPSDEYHSVLSNIFKNVVPNRTLFIGDSILTDMAFAAKKGFKKLLPLTGCTTKEELTNWAFEEELKPDYYTNSVSDLEEIIKNLTL